jgi:hypothetical protein
MQDTDREIAALEARVKLLRKQKLTEVEKQAVKWLLERDREEFGRHYIANLPKKVYCELAGRSRKSLDEQADTYNLPLRQPTIDLNAAVRVLHDRLIEFAEDARLAETSESVGLKDEKIRQEIRKIENQVAILQVDLKKRNSELIPRELVREAMQWLTGQLLAFGKTLARQHGDGAQQVLNEFLESLAQEIEAGALDL